MLATEIRLVFSRVVLNESAMKNSLFAPLVLVLVLGIHTGCTTHQQIRTSPGACRTTGTNVACQSAIIEETSSYVLGFVEFDDQGWLWSRDQMNTVITRLEKEEETERLLIVAFVHGWKHNARYDDTNVQMVRDNLRFLSLLERLNSKREGRKPRKVVGVYAGWRGLSSKVWGVKEFTFWERKNTAQEVGRGALKELFLRLEYLRNISHVLHAGETNQTRLFLIGHSFGGAATYAALAPVLEQRAIQTVDRKGAGGTPRGVGDMVILVNPAFEAARYGVFRDIATNQTYLVSNLVTLAIFTSKTDNATKSAFPLGRHVSTFFDKHQSTFQKKANRTAVGHFGEYITHDLTANTNKARGTKATRLREQMEDAEQISDRVVELKAKTGPMLNKTSPIKEDGVFHFIGSDLVVRRGNDPRMPLYNVSVDSKLIPDHNAIDEPEFLRFLSQFLTAFEPSEN
jgi:hypothetical protein